MSKYPEINTEAPSFKTLAIGGELGMNEDGVNISLSDYQGEIVVLYFYPKDDTPGCTKQACAIRDGWSELNQKAKIFGISPNNIKAHIKFIEKYNLPFPLISDEDKSISMAYGVWAEKMNFGRKYFGIERSTFIIGKDQKIAKSFIKVKPAEHLEKVLDFINTNLL